MPRVALITVVTSASLAAEGDDYVASGHDPTFICGTTTVMTARWTAMTMMQQSTLVLLKIVQTVLITIVTIMPIRAVPGRRKAGSVKMLVERSLHLHAVITMVTKLPVKPMAAGGTRKN